MTVTVLYGTESGNAELAANDVADALSTSKAVSVADLDDVDPGSLAADGTYLILCSTYGDGELPASARSFFDTLTADPPDLSGVKYAMFGLGDSDYEETFGNGAKTLDIALLACGATRVGEYGQHDASGRSTVEDSAVAWARATVGEE